MVQYSCKVEIFEIMSRLLNGISDYYHFDQLISILMVVGWYFFILIQILMEYYVTNSKDTDLQRLIWVCIVCLCPTKRTVAFFWVNAF